MLLQRLKVPPAISQFSKTLDKNQATDLFKLLVKYQPETKAAKQTRLRAMAEKGETTSGAPPAVIKFGLNHVTYLVEKRKAKLVVIAHDVNPIELVVWLPALCKKMGVPYVIVKGKGRLGQLVHQKNAAAIALTAVEKEDSHKLTSLTTAAKAQFNDTVHRTWGGGIMGLKTQRRLEKRAKLVAAEEAKKAQF